MSSPIVAIEPAPAELEGPLRSEQEVLHHRRLSCAHYDGCLNESIRRDWQGFTCTRCPISEANDGRGAAAGPSQKLGKTALRPASS